MKETELAQHFVKHLSCFDLYFEVDYYRCVDIVALADNYAAAIEVKTSFNLKVLEQAFENFKHFHYSYIAIPYARDIYFQERLCKDYGIGVLVYNKNDQMVTETIRPRLNRHADLGKLKKRLLDFNKQSLPGSKNGDGTKITAFGVTVQNLTTYVKRNPRCLLKDAVNGIAHHYRTNELARSALYKWIKNGIISHILIEEGILSIKIK